MLSPEASPGEIVRHWRRAARGRVGGVVVVLLFIGLCLLFNRGMSAGVVAIWVGPAVLLFAMGQHGAARLRAWERLVVASDGRLCPGCRQSLAGLSGVAQCPECGRFQDVERLRGQWREAFGMRG